MRRIAIIINEREMLRAGYVDFAPSLSSLPELSGFNLEVFDASNISKLFSSGVEALHNFDALFLGTNATSDLGVLQALKAGKNQIEDFIQAGNGLFIGSQKKLSVAHAEKEGLQGLTGFLPDEYDFHTVQRPKNEKDSGKGEVSFAQSAKKPIIGASSLLFSYPRKISAKEIQARCLKNNFKRHVYRSHIVPRKTGNFTPWLVDIAVSKSSNIQETQSRNLLMVSANPLRSTRIVLTTMVLDWAFHESLLVNIIRYISEGDPYVAFIGTDKQNSDTDFEYLISAAKLQKVTYITYSSIEEISSEFLAIHNTFVFSKDWEPDLIHAFWKKLQSDKPVGARRLSEYKQIYSFNKIGDTFGLNRISDRSSFDLIIDQAVLWIIAQFDGRMWGGSFWTSSDVLNMLLDLDIDTKKFLPSIITDIQKHNSDGSYDGVMSSTCGMLELFLQLRASNHRELSKLGIGKAEIDKTLRWIVNNLEAQSTYELQAAALILARLNHPEQAVNLPKRTKSIRQRADTILADHAETNALEIAKKLALSVKYGAPSSEQDRLLGSLKLRRQSDGSWSGPKQTSFVLVLILSDVVSFIDKSLVAKADDLVFQGIAYLRSTYDQASGCWDKDIQTTANSVHALGLFNRMYGYSSQDFFENIGLQSDALTHLSGVREAIDALGVMRSSLDSANTRLLASNAEKMNLQNSLTFSENYKKLLIKHAKRSRFLSAIFGSLFFGLIASLAIYHRPVLLSIGKEIGSISAIIVATVIGLIIAGFTKSPISEDNEKI